MAFLHDSPNGGKYLSYPVNPLNEMLKLRPRVYYQVIALSQDTPLNGEALQKKRHAVKKSVRLKYHH